MLRGSARRIDARTIAATMIAAVAMAPREGRAEAPTFSWTRAAGAEACPARSDVLAQLEALLGRPLSESLADRALEAVLAREPSGWVATLYWRSPSGALLGTQSVRSVDPSCAAFTRAAVTSALVAIVTDVHPSTEGPRPPIAPEPVAPPPTQPTNSRVPVQPEPVPPATPPAATNAARVRFGDIALGGVLAIGWLPVVTGGVQLYAEPLVYRRLRLGASATALAEAPLLRGIQASFSAVEFGLDACVSLLGDESRFGLLPCAGLRAGGVSSFVYDGSTRTGGTQGSFAAQASTTMRLDLRPLILSLVPALRWNLTRYTLLDSTARNVVAEQDAFGFVITLLAGVRIP